MSCEISTSWARAPFGANQVGVGLELALAAAVHAVLQAPVRAARRRMVEQGAHAFAVGAVHDVEVEAAGLHAGAELAAVAGTGIAPGAVGIEQRLAVEGRAQRLRCDRASRRRLGAWAPGAVDKGLHLGFQHFRRHRHEYVIAGAELQAARAVEVGRTVRGQEHDRGVARARALPHQARGLETVEPGHLHVHQDHAEILLQEAQQGLLARSGGDDRGVEVAQHRAQGEQGAGIVVDQQDRGNVLLDGGRGGAGFGVVRHMTGDCAGRRMTTPPEGSSGAGRVDAMPENIGVVCRCRVPLIVVHPAPVCEQARA
jgi:hypothetical protein